MVWVLLSLVSSLSEAAIPKSPAGVPSPGFRNITQRLPCQTALGIYNECHYSSIGLVNLLIEGTEGDCRLNSTYGIKPTHVWVKGSCSVTFRITRAL